jgi:hypothetical protein
LTHNESRSYPFFTLAVRFLVNPRTAFVMELPG